MEDSQFDQAVAMKQMGVSIPDSVIINSSRLLNKGEIIKQMEGDKESAEFKAQQALQQRAQEAEVSKTEGEAKAKHADAGLREAKTRETMVKAEVLANTPIEEPSSGADPELEYAKADHEAGLAERKQSHDEQMAFMEHGLKREVETNKLRLQAQDMAGKRMDARAATQQAAATAAQKPQPQGTSR